MGYWQGLSRWWQVWFCPALPFTPAHPPDPAPDPMNCNLAPDAPLLMTPLRDMTHYGRLSGSFSMKLNWAVRKCSWPIRNELQQIITWRWQHSEDSFVLKIQHCIEQCEWNLQKPKTFWNFIAILCTTLEQRLQFSGKHIRSRKPHFLKRNR